MELYLRKANKLDKKKTFEWFNDKLSRMNSFNSDEVSFEDHSNWFDATLENENRDLFICMDFMMPVGEIRLDYTKGNSAVISYMVDADARGEGYGKKMLSLVEKEAVKRFPEGITLYGEVKKDNIASVKTFEESGYTLSELSSESRAVYEKHVDEASVKKSKPLPKPAREVNFEILRVIAMLMVITLHYIGKGGLIAPANIDIKKYEFPFWVIECLCIVCVNVYVLISGYYMVDKKFKLSKLAALWCQIFFYSIVVTFVSIAVGWIGINDTIVLYKQFILLPVVMGHYWFATAYIIMYIFSPFLTKAMRMMDQRTHRNLIFLLLIPLCFAKSIIPYDVTLDDLGTSFVWFLVLFIIAGYIRIYGIKFFEKKINAYMTYILSAFGILVYRYMAASLNNLFPEFYLYNKVTNYNFVLVLTGSLGLFYIFKNAKFKDNFITRYLALIAPFTFGVYLFHEHITIRYTWIVMLRVGNVFGKNRILHMILVVLAIFTLGILIDVIRTLLFNAFRKLIIFALKIYYGNREIMDYLIFGVAATVVNWIAYIGCAYCFLIAFMKKGTTTTEMTANVIAWIAAVLFAYWTNRNFVFRSTITGFAARLREFWQFVAARIFSFLVELVMFFVMIHILKMNDIVSKLIVGIVVIILNYIFSKLWVFKDNKA